jgi:MFS family permease
MQLLGGTLADRFGGKIVMLFGILIFTSACAALPFTVAAVQAGAVRTPPPPWLSSSMPWSAYNVWEPRVASPAPADGVHLTWQKLTAESSL